MNITSKSYPLGFEIICRDGDVPSDIICWIYFVYQIPLVLIGFKTKCPKSVVFIRQSEKRSVSCNKNTISRGVFLWPEGVNLMDGFNGVCWFDSLDTWLKFK